MRKSLTIGQLAESAGVGVETVRYYQRRGLVAIPSKPPGGRRAYSELAVERISLIRRAQLLGFSLDEIAALLALGEGASGKSFAVAKLGELDARVEELNRMRRDLRVLVKRCEEAPRGRPCPLLQALRGETKRR